MMHHRLQLAQPLDFAGVGRVKDSLHALPGVDSVDAAPGAMQVGVGFDEQRTSPQELAAVLSRSGYALERKPHAGGSCCGGCGGH
ncbi:MAG: heavy-metal-associated domain-containing protein [Massilia sp.]|nr:heavy-metal-associated domain-containing protein [Massilia sp.]